MVHALEGMFAFAIWDERARRLLLARDRFGEKPLFLHEHDGELLFASELTALLEVKPQLRELDPDAIDAFFVFAYVPGPGTIVPTRAPAAAGPLAELGARARAHARAQLVVAAGAGDARAASRSRRSPPRRSSCSRSRCARAWSPTCRSACSSAAASTRRSSRRSPREQSSQRLQTFTVGYDIGAVNETERAREVAARLGSEHHEVTLTQADVAERAPRVLAALDQPLARPSDDPAARAVGVRAPARDGRARRRGRGRAVRRLPALPLARTGEARAGGDADRGCATRSASCCATPGALRARRRGRRGASRRRRCSSATSTGSRASAATAARRCTARVWPGSIAGACSRDLAACAGELDGGPAARWLMHLDQAHYLPDDVLVKTDRASMLVSLEIRTVFLHAGLAELAGSLDTSLHLAGGGQGARARDAARRPAAREPRRALSQDRLQGPGGGVAARAARAGRCAASSSAA